MTGQGTSGHADDQAVDVLKLPNMNEFSPGSIGSDIQQLLTVVSANATPDDAATAIISTYPGIAATPDATERRKRARNILIGLNQCHFTERDGRRVTTRLTSIGEKIKNATTQALANDLLAGHILENCHGLELIDIVDSLRSRGVEVNDDNIRNELEDRGYKVTENEGNAGKLRQWMELSGVINSRWIVNDAVLHRLLGFTSPTLSMWYGLPRSQRIFLEKLKEIDVPSVGAWRSVRQVKKLSELSYGRDAFPTGRLRQLVIEPLVTGNWIEARGTGQGRGGDSGDVKAKALLSDLKIKLPIDTMSRIPVDLRSKLSTPLDVIFSELESPDPHVKGVALELLALNIVRDLGLIPVGFRLRSRKAHGAEVDLVAEGVHLHFSRWVIQCKNTPSRSLEIDYIAKEVGIAVILKAHVVMMVTTGTIGAGVRGYADSLAQSSPLQAVLIDKTVLSKYKGATTRPSRAAGLIDHLHDNARFVMRLKRRQLPDAED